MELDHTSIEEKWQEEWSETGISIASRDDRPKFMIIFAYPGVTGYLHVGHLRGYTYTDAIARYKRMLGYNVMFPVGTHATGNGAISLANRIKREDPDIIEYMKSNGCTDEILKTLTEPMAVVNYFNDIYVNDYWKRFGFLADWRRFTCTLNPDYGKFIEWQFRKLMDAGLLIQKPYFAPFCPNCGPVAIDASETDISKGGSAEVQEYVLMKFEFGEMKLIAATLRPETVYGQVCFWVNPDTDYVKIEYGEEVWIVSKPAADKLRMQYDGIEDFGTVRGRDLVGWTCKAPMVGRIIPILPATFVDPEVGTGMVTSVPSDSPDDYINLKYIKDHPEEYKKYGIEEELIASIEPISIIDIEGYSEFSAKDVIEEMGITGPDDPKLEEAKKKIYRDGFHSGVMNASSGSYAGMRVEEAKEKMRDAMLESGEAVLLHDLSEEVVCRCGENVRVKRIDDQWFIDYSGEELTKKTSDHCREMSIYPPEYQTNIHGTLDWFRERACVRQGNWLGTRFPFDDKWIIEAISDSTLYPIYYVISLYANTGNIKPEGMNESFFDYVILGKGDENEVAEESGITPAVLNNIREDVKYWYPLDVNLGGKEHMTVHFPAFLFNHMAILPEKMQPKGIVVNWYITGKQSKISKSKGGAQPIPGAVKTYGVDAMRLYYSHVASMFIDVEWNEEILFSYKQRVDRIFAFANDLIETSGPKKGIDKWLRSRFQTHVSNIRDIMKRYDLRQMATSVYYEMYNDLRWYLRRGGADNETLMDVLKIWVQSMMPITPHMAEELWSLAGFEGMVSESLYPEPRERYPMAEYGEDLIRSTISDVSQIRKVAEIEPSKICIYTSPSWKKDVYRIAADILDSGEELTIPILTKEVMSDPEIRANGKAASELSKKVAVELIREDPSRIRRYADTDEFGIIKEAAEFLGEELGSAVLVYDADDKGKYDPKNRSSVAVPGRPAIYLE
ncbi:MAG: leucine--tRNA ligase [Candidatus Methanomethylophilaceae archaeon]|jgi:leucyl-tRNA synthetase